MSATSQAFEEVALESAGPGGALQWKMDGHGSWHAKPPVGGGAFDVIPTQAGGYHTWWLHMGRDGRTAGKATDLGVHATLGAAFGAARDFLDSEYGGKRAAASEEAPTAAAKEERAALRWAEISFDLREDASKFARLIEKIDRTIVASHQGLVVTTNASGRDIEKVLKRTKWKEGYSVSRNAEKFDQAAECCADANCAHRAGAHASEQVNVVHEESPTTPAYLQCTGSPEVYKQWVDFGDKFGPITNTRRLYDLLAKRMQTQDQEVFIVVVVDLYGHVRGISEVNRGERSAVNVSVTQIMRIAAMVQGGTAFLCAHLHPSGKCKPSKADRELTKTIERAADPHGDELKFIDHVVIGHGEFYSIKENKLFKV